MAAPELPREGAWVGGLHSTGFAVQCRSDAAHTFTVEVCKQSDFATLEGSVTSETLSTTYHFRDTVYVTGLTPGRKYYWRVKLTSTDPIDTYGTEETYTAGVLKTHDTGAFRWKAAFLGCVHNAWINNDGICGEMSDAWRAMVDRGYDFHIHSGDTYYSDVYSIGTTDYAVGTVLDPATDADADKPAYRTNFMNTYSQFDLGGDYSVCTSRTKDFENNMADFKCRVPGYNIADDHDIAYNDCSDRVNQVGDRATRWQNGRDVAHECFLNLNKALIDADTDSSGSARTFTAYSSWDNYYVVDVPPARFVVLDTRNFRDLKTDADSVSKSMLGTEQLAWLKARIDDNTQKFLFIVTGSMLDGYHGWNESTDDGWVNYSYERDEILDYVRANGDPARTIFLSGDTHNMGVYRHHGKDDKEAPIWEVHCGNTGWNYTYHDWINGLKAAATGQGATREFAIVHAPGCAEIEHIGRGRMRLALNVTHPGRFNKSGVAYSSNQPVGIIWQRVFK